MGQMVGIAHLLSIMVAQVLLQTTVIIGSGFVLCILFRNRPENQNTICRFIIVALLLAPVGLLLTQNEFQSTLSVTLPFDRLPLNEPPLNQTSDAVQSYHYPSFITELDIVNILPREMNELAGPVYPLKIPVSSEVHDTNTGIHKVSVTDRNNPFTKYLRFIYCGVAIGWIVLVILGVVRMIFSYNNLRYIIRTGIPTGTEIQQLTDTLASSNQVKSPAVLISPFTHSPFLAGFIRPVIVVPEYLPVTNDIIVHELMHLKRNDLAWSFCGHLLLVVLPIQPLLLVLANLLEETNDLICDHLVVEQVGNARHYACRLISLASLLNPECINDSFGVGLLPSRKSLRFRISRILQHDLYPISPLRKYAVLISGAVLFLVSGMTGYIEVRGGELRGERVREFIFASPLSIVPQLKQTLLSTRDTAGITVEKFASADSEPSIEKRTTLRRSITKEKGLHSSEIPSLPPAEWDILPVTVKITDEPLSGSTNSYRNTSFDLVLGTEKLSPAGHITDFNIPVYDSGPQNIGSSGIASFGTAEVDIPGAPWTVARFNIAKPVNVTCDYDYDSMSTLTSAEDIERLHYYLSLDRFKQEVAWSPDGRNLAFSDNNRIWLVSVEGGEPVLVYEYKQNGFSVGAICDLSFSPDGSEIVFTKNTYDPERGSIIKITYQTNEEPFGTFSNPIPNIECVNPSTGMHRVLMEEAYNGVWSHDGSKLFYHLFDPKIYTGIHGDLHMRPMIYDTLSGEKTALATEDLFYGRGTFSPDGSYLVIPKREYGQPTQLFRLNLSGSGDMIPLTSYDPASDTGRNIRTPAFDPSGRWILYTDASWRPDAPDQGLWVYSMVTGRQYPLFEQCAYEQFGAVWDPTGQRYSFIRKLDGVNHLYIMDFIIPEQEKKIVRDIDKPLTFELKPNYPNPFNVETTIEFSIPEPGDVTLRIYSITGQQICTLVDSPMDSGRHRIVWDGRDDSGNEIASGTYLSQLILSGNVRRGKMTLLK